MHINMYTYIHTFILVNTKFLQTFNFFIFALRAYHSYSIYLADLLQFIYHFFYLKFTIFRRNVDLIETSAFRG